jgi:hypothetical protein
MDRSVGWRFRALLCFAATAIGAAAPVTTDSRAEALPPGQTAVVTTNSYGGGKSIWITIYDLFKLWHLDYGCVGSAAAGSWQGGHYGASIYYVRAEVKAGPSCGGATVCDTTVQLMPQSHDGKLFWGTKVTLLPNGKNCYWRHDDPNPPPGFHR